jgi:tetratricopeptide (TPR) repeat protein
MDQKKTEEILDQIASLPLGRADQLLLTAGIYAQAGLYAYAIVTYGEALELQNFPEARVTLGDLYSSVGLIMLAESEYRQALAGASDPVARAAAEFGLGQVAYCRKLFSEARAHFERSQKLYASVGLLAEAEEAGSAAAHLQDHPEGR